MKPAAFQNVHIFPKISPRGPSQVVRWRVEGRTWQRSYPNKARAQRGQRELHNALDRGERFDPESGLPESWTEANVETVASYAVRWFEREARGWSEKNTDVRRDALTHVLTACTDEPPTGDLRTQVRAWIADACTIDREPAPELDRAGEWLQVHSLPLTAITPALLRDRILPALERNLDGSKAKPSVLSKRRTTLSAMLSDAFADELISANPFAGMRRSTRSQQESGEVDVRTIPSPLEFRAFICEVANRRPSGRRLVAFLAFILYTGARPGEVNAVRDTDLTLPDDGSWGRVVLSGSHTQASTRSGGVSRRGLKSRAPDVRRVVRLHPDLVAMLRLHMVLFPPAVDGFVFRNSNGGLFSTNQSRVIVGARERLGWVGDHPFAEVSPYTGRHVHISALIHQGVNPVEIARLCGNTPEVILSNYAGVFASMRSDTEERVAAALAW